ncbi:MAG: HAMP domain-containing protein, partial [Gammaproteobacteria bacterium]|nr:HAMP domain-containing protein [Gammaproteobacteria bacterium]
MSFWNDSLRNKILVIFAAALIANTIIAEIFLELERSSTEQMQTIIERDVAHERQISALVAAFKIQVQEWKNVLIRGHDDAQRDKYWKRFEAKHDEIQSAAQTLLSALPAGSARDLVSDFKQSHANLRNLYQQGRDAFVASGFDHKAGDKAVSGIDRAPTKTLQDAADRIAQEVAVSSTDAIASAQKAVTISRVSIFVSTLVLVVLAFWVLSQQLTKPIASLMVHVDRFGDGDFSQPIHSRSNDELGRMRQQLGNAQAFLRD